MNLINKENNNDSHLNGDKHTCPWTFSEHKLFLSLTVSFGSPNFESLLLCPAETHAFAYFEAENVCLGHVW